MMADRQSSKYLQESNIRLSHNTIAMEIRTNVQTEDNVMCEPS